MNNESDHEAVFHKIIRYDRNNPQTLKKYQADESKYDTKKEIKEIVSGSPQIKLFGHKIT